MAIYIGGDRYEFDLTIKHYGEKRQEQKGWGGCPERDVKPVEELKEKLTFNARTASEVIRKLLDYIHG